ncbi:sugar ABC transporter permease [bacterium]|nr:sugar ABC transporter permease [bacterium]
MMGINYIGIATIVERGIRRTFRVATQTLIAPVVSSALYIFIFGTVIGSRIQSIDGVPYITFVFPGVLMLSIINASFSSASSTLYFMRFARSIEELLIAPFSYLEMMFGLMLESIARALMVSFLVLAVGVLFGAVTLVNPVAFIVYTAAIAGIFALLGILVALWSESFEQLQMLNTFIITPLTYLGGIFYSIEMLPPLAKSITLFNPFFYFADGIRSSMIGVNEGDLFVGTLMIIGVLLILGTAVFFLFKKGWKIRS